MTQVLTGPVRCWVNTGGLGRGATPTGRSIYFVEDDRCDFCGESVAENGVWVEASKGDPFRVASGYFCSWEHAASWFATGESDKDFDVIFPDGSPSTRRERLWEAVEPVGVFVLFLWACALILIGSWTAANWIFPFNE